MTSPCTACKQMMTTDDHEADDRRRQAITDPDYDDPKLWNMKCIRCRKHDSDQQRRDDMTAYTTCG